MWQSNRRIDRERWKNWSWLLVRSTAHVNSASCWRYRPVSSGLRPRWQLESLWLGARKRSLPLQKEKREKEKKADIKYSTKIYCNLRCQQGKDESPVQIGWLLRIATGQPEPAICSPEPINVIAHHHSDFHGQLLAVGTRWLGATVYVIFREQP